MIHFWVSQEIILESVCRNIFKKFNLEVNQNISCWILSYVQQVHHGVFRGDNLCESGIFKLLFKILTQRTVFKSIIFFFISNWKTQFEMTFCGSVPRPCSRYEQFLRLIKQDYQQPRLKLSFRKFFGRFNDLVSKYRLSLSRNRGCHTYYTAEDAHSSAASDNISLGVRVCSALD